jgi:two-component system, NtrC family, nitrogen regulation response regulator NtrX
MKQKIVARILIADDEPSIRRAFKDILINEPYEVDLAIDGDDCLAKVKLKHYDVILLDLKMPNKDGMECLKLIPTLSPKSAIIVLSGNQDPNLVAQCFKNGVTDYLEKPSNLFDIINVIRQAVNTDKLPKFSSRRTSQYQSTSGIPQIIGESKAIQKLKQDIESVAFYDKEGVLIMGGNGSGKELVAQWVHVLSPRRSKPIVEFSCATISPHLIMSTLFGYVKNAFTDAKEDTMGLFQAADGGTLFLDEIGEMPSEVQSAMLRVLESGSIMPVGGTKTIPVDVRIVAATNKNLYEAAIKGTFRQDLLYRLERLIIKVPSLNERIEDIPLLAEHFKDVFYTNYQNIQPKAFSKSAFTTLENVDWTGNVRQLKNVVTKLMVHSKMQIIDEKEVKILFQDFKDDWHRSIQ